MWIAPALSLSLAETIPTSSQWFDGALPMESAVLRIPKGTFRHPEGGHVDGIAFRREPSRITIVAGSGWIASASVISLFPIAEDERQAEMESMVASLEKPKLTMGIWSYLRNLIAIIAAEPDIIKPGICTARRASDSTGNGQEYWTRAIVGGDLELQTNAEQLSRVNPYAYGLTQKWRFRSKFTFVLFRTMVQQTSIEQKRSRGDFRYEPLNAV